MFLTVAERLAILQILPAKGNYTTLKILTQLRLNLGFTEDEFKEWGIVFDQETGRVTWEEEGVAEIPIGEVATGLVVDALRELDRKKGLSANLVGIYEKFIPTTE